MGQLGTADVTYTMQEYGRIANPSRPMGENTFLLAFPNNAGTNNLYTSGGIPLSNAMLGCPASLVKLIMEDDGSSVGAVYKWDQKANTIRAYLQGNLIQGATGSTIAATALVEMLTSATVTSTTLRVIAQGW